MVEVFLFVGFLAVVWEEGVADLAGHEIDPTREGWGGHLAVFDIKRGFEREDFALRVDRGKHVSGGVETNDQGGADQKAKDAAKEAGP